MTGVLKGRNSFPGKTLATALQPSSRDLLLVADVSRGFLFVVPGSWLLLNAGPVIHSACQSWSAFSSSRESWFPFFTTSLLRAAGDMPWIVYMPFLAPFLQSWFHFRDHD